MENASNALLIAGGILIGVLVLSIGVYLYTMFGTSGASISDQLNERQIDEFNAQFYKYENLDTIKIHDIISVANLAKQNNINYEYTSISEGPFYITVTISNLPSGDGANLETIDTEKSNELLRKYSLNGSTPICFKCTKVTFNPNTKRVNSITFEKID